MNRNLLKVSMLVVSASALFIAGCGPENMNAAFADDSNISNNEAQEQGGFQGPQGGPAQQGMGPQDGQGQQQGPGPQAGPGPQGGGPGVQGGGGCPTGQCEIPPDPDTSRAVQLPDQAAAQPIKIMPTGEKQLANDLVDYHTTRHISQPSERHHTVHKHRNLHNRYFLKIVYHPTFRRINRIIRTFSSSQQTMPTEEVVAPTVDYGCGGVIEAPSCGAGY